MGICESKIQQGNIPQKERQINNIPVINQNVKQGKPEICGDHKYIPLNIQNEIAKSICKITIKAKGKKDDYGTGFFMNISDSLHCLVANYHVINEEMKNENIEIEIYNNKNEIEFK